MQRIVDIPEEVWTLVDARRLDARVISATQRPTQEDYYRYMHLVAAYREMSYNWAEIFQRGEFRVQDEFNLPHPVPTTSRREAAFDPDKYWRGPSWVVTNWFIVRGLEQYAGPCRDFGQYVRNKTLEMAKRSGLWEYFNPLTGEGRGAMDYSWTAALAIDLSLRK